MSTSIYDRVKILIEETSDAYSSCGPVNADYAEFATLALAEFKNILRDPRLTRHQLMSILRSGMNDHSTRRTESCGMGWADFMAGHVEKTANRNRPSTPVPRMSWGDLQEARSESV
ncbi:MAG: hypothetical protein K9G62_04145 [Alphaproteobacteria bacterium]|nr:hypothetical protein [Alphaproteobacteria bacterium]